MTPRPHETRNSLFRMQPSNLEGADVLVSEAPHAYEVFWRPLYTRQFIPKFLVANWLATHEHPDVHYVGGFQLMPNLWHSTNGPGRHARAASIHRWIAWHVPQHGRADRPASWRSDLADVGRRRPAQPNPFDSARQKERRFLATQDTVLDPSYCHRARNGSHPPASSAN